MKNVVKLENFFHPDQLREAIGQFVDRYNNQRYHESLNNLTPADVYDQNLNLAKAGLRLKVDL
ncbi:hypothetical protein GCM10010967_57260 [Dyadobacter beijingensis]|uniref:Integrase catalytic domain-containing protein n=2 Tax=Dyadobacter beijingensis TaxID=365489 RepID=A0ABQ2ILN5_9BACT|nr:hypothetical protein GCM10010967_57260 [Dyadobacter beijingensis]